MGGNCAPYPEGFLCILENWLQGLIVAAAFLTFLLAILTYIGSAGDPTKVKKSKEYLVSAITALVALALVRIFLK